MRDQEDLGSGADLLTAHVYGDSIPAMKMAALDEARALYGPDAVLAVEEVTCVNNTFMRPEEKGRFHAMVKVRCRNLPEEDR